MNTPEDKFARRVLFAYELNAFSFGMVRIRNQQEKKNSLHFTIFF